MCGECEEKETFGVLINVRLCNMAKQGHSVSWELCKICLWEEKLSLCQAFVVSSKNKCAKFTQICTQGIFKFCQNLKVFASAGRSTFL